jgi:hypothetical protein
VLRDFLLQLPDPVIPTDALSQYVAISGILLLLFDCVLCAAFQSLLDISDPPEKIAEVLKINQTLPEPHKVFLDIFDVKRKYSEVNCFVDIITHILLGE